MIQNPFYKTFCHLVVEWPLAPLHGDPAAVEDVEPLGVRPVQGLPDVVERVHIDRDARLPREDGGVLHPLLDRPRQVQLRQSRLRREVVLLDGVGLVHVDHGEQDAGERFNERMVASGLA